jgi:O-antigen ligase
VKREAVALAIFLLYAILTLWVEQRWAWNCFQVAIFALASRQFAWRKSLPHHPALVPLAGAVLWAAAQLRLGVSVSPAATGDQAWNWFTFFLVCGLSAGAGSDPAGRRLLLRILVISGMILATVSALQQVSSGGRIFWLFPSGFTEGVLGPFVNRNQYSAWVELLLPAALYLAAGRSRYRGVYVCAAAVLYGSVIAGASRSGFLLTTAEAVLTLALLALHKRLPRKVFIQFAGFALLATLVAGWQGLLTRFQTTSVDLVRVDALRASLQMVKDHPWTGTGLGTWSQIYPRYAGFDPGAFVNQAHNDWAQWAAEGGIPFAVLLLFFAGLCCRPAFRSIYGLGILAFLTHALIDYPMQQRPELAAWFFAIAGLAISEGRARARGY